MKVIIVICILFLSTYLSAQTGPAGVGNATNNVLWLSGNYDIYNDAGITLATNNDNVEIWNDRSGNNNHAIQTTNANKPNYFSNVVNGFPAVRYSAANADHLTVTSVATSNLASIWTIASYASLPSPNPGVMQASPSGLSNSSNVNDKVIGLWVANSSNVWGRAIQSNNTTRNISQTTSLSANTFYNINTICRTNRVDQYVNNAAAGNNTSHNGTLSSWTDISIGRQGTESWNGDIAEVIIYNTEVNSAQRIIIDNYLSAKYDFGLATNNIYTQDNVANGNYDFEVAGIGRVDASNIHDDAQGSGMVRILNPTGLDNDEFLIWGHDNGLAEAQEFTDVPAGVDTRLVRTWRVSEVSSSGIGVNIGSIDMRWDLNDLGSITASDLRLLIDNNNNGTFTDDASISGAVDLGSGIYEFQNVPGGVGGIRNNRRFTIATINSIQTPLPIELLTFEARHSYNNSVQIQWETANETNNDYFTVERFTNKSNWRPIRVIKGAGNSNKHLTYHIIDTAPSNGIIYYRLKQTDFDGKFSYSKIVSIEIDETRNSIIIYPNPTEDLLTIRGEELKLSEIRLYNIQGIEVTEKIEYINQSESIVIIKLSNLPTGTYFLSTQTSTTNLYKQ
jgi:hypothetical protein